LRTRGYADISLPEDLILGIPDPCGEGLLNFFVGKNDWVYSRLYVVTLVGAIIQVV
jgi:hypothetical protein